MSWYFRMALVVFYVTKVQNMIVIKDIYGKAFEKTNNINKFRA